MNFRFLTLLIIVVLTGCKPANDAQALQADYLYRLANATAVEINADSASSKDKLYRMPARRDRVSEIPDLRISLLDLIIDVHRCPALQIQISDRNSILGKQMLASNRLGYEGDLLREIAACQQSLTKTADNNFNQQLSQLAIQKRAQLPQVYWNALNASPEFEQYLRFAPTPLPIDVTESDPGLDALAQLVSIGQKLPEQLPPGSHELDPLFFALLATEQGGQLISSLSTLTQTLNQGSMALEERQMQRPICPQQRATRQARILQNVFVKFYAGGLQPYLAKVDQRGKRWSASLLQMSEIEQIPPTLQQYLLTLAGPDNSLWTQFEQATKRHVKAWQDTLKSCGLAPGQSGWVGAADKAAQ